MNDGCGDGPIQPSVSGRAVSGNSGFEVDSDSDIEEIYDETADYMALPKHAASFEGASTPSSSCPHD